MKLLNNFCCIGTIFLYKNEDFKIRADANDSWSRPFFFFHRIVYKFVFFNLEPLKI